MSSRLHKRMGILQQLEKERKKRDSQAGFRLQNTVEKCKKAFSWEGIGQREDCGLRIADFKKSRKQRFSCGSGVPRPACPGHSPGEPVEGQTRSCALNDFYDFNAFYDLPLTVYRLPFTTYC
jgi:hypothetical protein